MGTWENGPGMIQAPELEEGEACYYKDDRSMDPDIALSYIGDRVQSLLGHLQKDFEGGVSAENLGAKFGGYGSFLPMHRHSPLVSSQPKYPDRVQNSRKPRYPNDCVQEGSAPSSTKFSDAPSTQRNGFSSSSSSPSIYPTQHFKVSSEDTTLRENILASSYKVVEAFPGKSELSPSKSANPTEQRTLKVRLKLGSEMVAQYNAEIDSLGLASPSSSTENCLEESARSKLESGEPESPAKILQVMTSFLVSGASLLSPLCEDFLRLGRATKSSSISDHGTNPESSADSLGFENKDIATREKAKPANKSEIFEKSENECILDINDSKNKTMGSKSVGCRLQPLSGLDSRPSSDAACCTSEPLKEAAMSPEVVRGSEKDVSCENIRGFDKDVPLKKRKGSKDRLNGRSSSSNLVENASLGCMPTQSCGNYDQQESRGKDEHSVGEDLTRVSQNDILVHRGQDSRSTVKSSSNFPEGESVKVAMNKFSLKLGQKAKSGKQDNIETPLDVNNLSVDKKPKVTQNNVKLASKSADILRNGDRAALKDKGTGKKLTSVHLNQKDVLDTSERMDKPKRLLGGPFSDRSKISNLDAAKEETGYADKTEGKSSNKKYTDKMTPGTHVIESPAETKPCNDRILNGTEGTMVDPVLIEENWVACDRCEKWRLLPYGTKPNQLPDKWVCSMLDWLPGMNSCDVKEDDTTDAVHASLSVPTHENHYNSQAHDDRSMFGVASVGVHHFAPNHQKFTSDKLAYRAKRQTLKESSNTVGMSDPATSNNVPKNFHRHSTTGFNLKVVNQPLAGAEATKECKFQHKKKSAISIGKLNKRKDDNMNGEFSNSRKKIKKESLQHVQGMVKKIESKGALDDFQVSGGNLDLLDSNMNAELANKEAVKDEKKSSVRKDLRFKERGNLQMHVKRHKDRMQNISDGELFNVNASNRKEVSARKRNFKDCDNRENEVESRQLIKEEDKEIDFQIEPRSIVSQIDDEFKRSKNSDLSKRKVVKPRVILSGSKEKPTSSCVKEKRQPKNLKVKLSLTTSLTKEDIDELRKDLGCEEFSLAATSSSSKISDSRKNRTSFVEVKGSPEESVSSSPMRTPCLNQVLPVASESAGNVGSRINGFSALNRGKKSFDGNRNSELGILRKGRDSGSCHVESFRNSVSFREGMATEIPCGERVSSGNLPCEFLEMSLVDEKSSILEQCGQCPPGVLMNCIHRKEGMSMDPSKELLPQQKSGKSFARHSMVKDRTHGGRLTEKASDPSTGSEVLDLKDKLKEETDVDDNNCALQCEVLSNVKHSFSDESSIKSVNHGRSVTLETSSMNENAFNLPKSTSLKEAQDALKKAEKLKSHASLIKSSGFGSESNYEHLKAALQYLHGASLLEAYSGESIRNLETSLIQIYGTAAKLCETCAYEYEKSCELASAALAYKCVEVAYLKIVYRKSSSTHRIWRDLAQASMQMLPQGESSSSSASDVDNLNNLPVADWATSSKGNDSHALNHDMVPRNRANVARLLDFTKDVNSAMEAAKRSLDTFKAAHVKFEESHNKDAIASVKRVIDFSFHDVEELINSMSLALDAINRQAPSRARE